MEKKKEVAIVIIVVLVAVAAIIISFHAGVQHTSSETTQPTDETLGTGEYVLGASKSMTLYNTTFYYLGKIDHWYTNTFDLRYDFIIGLVTEHGIAPVTYPSRGIIPVGDLTLDVISFDKREIRFKDVTVP